MDEESEKRSRQTTEPAGSEALASLSLRVAALEHQIAILNAAQPRRSASSSSAEAPGAAMLVRPGEEVEVGERAPPAPPPLPARAYRSPPAAATTGRASLESQSLENRLGSQIFSRVGIVALLVAAALFLKWAVDNRWIGPTGRVLAGLVAGTGLVVWSERFRRNGFHAFSYSLKAVGSGVLYLSLWAAFQLYHLLPAGAALTAMLLITAWNAYMAWSQDAELLAAYALIGGCATPWLLSTGGNHEVFLFTYLLAIDISIIVLVRLKSWPRLLLGIFPATAAYFIGWYSQFGSPAQLATTSVFIALFFAAFASVPVGPLREPPLEEQRRRAPGSILTEILLPIANAAFGSLAFYSVLQDAGHHDATPWMVLGFAAIYLGLMRLPQSAVASAVHLSLAVVLLTIAIPLKASGPWITVSWLAEGTVLLWSAARMTAATSVLDDAPAQPSRVLRMLGAAALLLGFGGVLSRLEWIDSSVADAFLNRRFATVLTGIAAFSVSAWIAFRAGRRTDLESSPEALDAAEHELPAWVQIGGASIVAVNLLAVLGTVREIAAMWDHTVRDSPGTLQEALAISAFLMVYGAGLLVVGFWKRSAFVRWQALLLIVYSIAKTFLYDMRNLSQGYRVASFMALGALLMAVSFAYQKDWLALRDSLPSGSVGGEKPKGKLS